MSRFVRFEDGGYYNLNEVSAFRIEADIAVDDRAVHSLTGTTPSEVNAPPQTRRYSVIARMKQISGERTQELVVGVFPSQETAEQFIEQFSE
ncbi:hypothetical protein ACFFLM_06020 [Deinococcus oregonensis]|uniref:Uncharacterized protein n=1 Tax=Deinococcus oregonensis TaxID=1805970 RepID=A0ABV6AZE3_9DEIO